MQSKKGSLMEALTNIVVGYSLNYFFQYFLLNLIVGVKLTTKQNLTMGAVFTVVSLCRSYLLRRLFNWMSQHHKLLLDKVANWVDAHLRPSRWFTKQKGKSYD